jgi:hypothetical protein
MSNSDATLRIRIAILAQHGVDCAVHQKQVTADLVDVVGDLTLYEIKRMVDLAIRNANQAIVPGAELGPALAIFRGHDDTKGGSMP